MYIEMLNLRDFFNIEVYIYSLDTECLQLFNFWTSFSRINVLIRVKVGDTYKTSYWMENTTIFIFSNHMSLLCTSSINRETSVTLQQQNK